MFNFYNLFNQLYNSQKKEAEAAEKEMMLSNIYHLLILPVLACFFLPSFLSFLAFSPPSH